MTVDRRGAPWFAIWVGAAAVLGVVVRYLYVTRVHPGEPFFEDALWYHLQAGNIRDGTGYVNIGQQFSALLGRPESFAIVPTAYWPPGYPGFLAGVQTVFGESLRTSQLAGCLTGAATIVLTGVLARMVAGVRIGVLAAFLVALSPYLIATDGSMMSETLYVPLGLLALVLAQRARTHPTWVTWCALGVTIGLATLVRGDALLLVPFVVVPAAVLSHLPARVVVTRVAASLALIAVVLAPWVVRNANELDSPTISTISANGVFAAANCDAVYSGSMIGAWSRPCMREDSHPPMTEAEYATWLRDRGVGYALDHWERWPAVGAARVARAWGVWDPVEQTEREAVESRRLAWQRLAWPLSLLTAAVGIVGFALLARRGRPIAMLVAPVAMATFLALVVYGNPRFRSVAEPVLLIGVAAAIFELLERTNLVERPASTA